ncbi:surface antigen D15 domain-containing protein [Nostoc commune NIES-4072]|uniref:Surface antigen D15 domain-containing protein n=1 Tax=Nostoc commune NIES-4072 TaxID=2005467 RepID=A0A2R5FKX7_NOSCO|nr:surface antigen D15 domain-containing protein [Nostoc commune HK-02]GBG18925.1 surface antigen D15 domain-containing protein [Nostoc commune NIES-4072]
MLYRECSVCDRPSSDNEFALSLAFDFRRSQTFILNDIPFSFTKGTEDGRSRVTAIRFSQDWLQRNANSVLAARSQFNTARLRIFNSELGFGKRLLGLG